ncbi:cyclin [Ordospora pajunii]|uniref:cyclin n=1 Tax=Ordospora pajunii TaxID=3039483 RepID=UPI0029529148|nr:cyclin [Ordospora pajunii]KAH9410839.1 cyclin [Ordospora pajunii]
MKRVFEDITNVSRKNIKLTIHKSAHRKKLLRWLYEVVNDFEYSQVTFSIAVLILDRYVEMRGLDLTKYQLVGISALFLSAKLEEKHLKTLDDYVFVTSNSFLKQEILDKEIEMLKALEFDMIMKLPHCLLREAQIEKMSERYSMKQRQEIFFCAFSYLIEKNSCRWNALQLYTKGIHEASSLFSGCEADTDFKFYLENNRVIKGIFMYLLYILFGF